MVAMGSDGTLANPGSSVKGGEGVVCVRVWKHRVKSVPLKGSG